MKKNIHNVILASFALATLLSLTGCGSSDNIQSSDPINIAFVCGIADGETKINAGIDELAALPANPGTDYTFISAEGEPTTIGEAGTIPDLSERGYTNVMMERVRAGIKADLTERLASYEPVSPEIDMAAATELAVRTLNAHAVEGRQNVLVYYCSGKSTAGLVNMLETPVYELDVEHSITAIAQKMTADMSSIDVIWYCCGDLGTDTDQPKFSANEKAQLKAFYEQLFTALGAKSVTFKDDLPSAECYHFPSTPVSSIAVEGTVSGLKDLVIQEPDVLANTTALNTPIIIPEEQVQYKPDSAEFLDPNAAAMTIQPVADFLSEYPELNILLYSTCAGDMDSEYTLWLSKARSDSLKNALVATGIDENRITVVTIKAADDPYYKFGLGTGSEANVNRKTVMIDMSTEFAQQILSKAI